jgi:hypothetical protein
VQNRRNVQVGSHQNQAKPHTRTDGFLHHTRLGLVGWISYWWSGDSALAVDILVVLINTLGLTELVSEQKQMRSDPNRFTTWVPGGMYFSCHDVSEYELGASGLPRASVSPQQPSKN